jgi:hypothetical protein
MSILPYLYYYVYTGNSILVILYYTGANTIYAILVLLYYTILLYHGRLVWGSKKYRIWDPIDEWLYQCTFVHYYSPSS